MSAIEALQPSGNEEWIVDAYISKLKKYLCALFVLKNWLPQKRDS